MTGRRLLQALGLTLIVFLLTGCGGVPAEPTATPTPVPTATPLPHLHTASHDDSLPYLYPPTSHTHARAIRRWRLGGGALLVHQGR